MPFRDTTPAGAPCWVDLSTSDVDRARDFYSQLLGWSPEEPNEEFGGYFNFRRNDLRIAGCMAAQPGTGVPDVWSVFLQTDDVEKILESAVAHGGQVIVPAMAVADLGVMAYMADPTGAAVGLWQQGQHKGFGLLGEAGAPCWFELHTRDYGGAVDFYRSVLGWDLRVESDTDEFRYAVSHRGEEDLAGVMDSTAFLPEGVPAHWEVYFGVEDADAACATVPELGGSVIQPAEDTPYGRLAMVTDPMGAQFRIVQAPAAA